MTDKQSPKAELIVTLDKAWELLGSPSPMNLAQVRGLLDHARAVAKRVGEEGRKKKVSSHPSLEPVRRGRGVGDPAIPREGGGA